MEDKEKIYLDKVIELLVSSTKMDYDKDKIKFPFYSPTLSFSLDPVILSLSHSSRPSLFSEYCRDYYGLTEQEIKYVWGQYKTKIKLLIDNS